MMAARNSQTVRTIALLIAVCLVSIPAQAQYGGGMGEPDDPYQIATAEDLSEIGNHPEDWDKCFVLVSNIDMAGFSYATALIAPDTNSTKSGFQGTPFTGIFDGNGHIISNLTIETKGVDNDYLGLFGYIDKSGQVKNLGIEDANIAGGSGSGYLGGLAGSNGYYKSGGGTITNCYSTGRISGDGSVGGLVGVNWGSASNCYSTARASGDRSVGGLIGGNYGVITNCHSTGTVSGGLSVGGLVGGNSSNVSNCYSTGVVSGTEDVGGLVGYNWEGSVLKCYSTGPANGKDSIGGLVGSNWSNVSHCYSTGAVSGERFVGGLVGSNSGGVLNSYSTGTVSGNEHVGGLVGTGEPVRVKDSVWDVETSGLTVSAGGTGLTTAEMMDPDVLGLNGLGGDPNWVLDSGRDYPRLVWEGTPGQVIPVPFRAFLPDPHNGAVNVIQPLILRWRAGGSARHHDVYLGKDEQAVANATTESPGIYRGRQPAEMTSYDPGILELSGTHYWRIDEVSEADPNSPWKGSVWSFTTANFIVVDDFEAYDDFCNRIFHTWLDGWGFSADPDCGVPAYPGNGTGSFVGCMWPIIRWCDIAHGGMQSMPFVYDNTGTAGRARYSETERTWDAWQDWTREGVKALTLWLYGDPCNSPEPLYVALEDSMGKIKVVNHDDANAVQIPGWYEWNIDLREFSNAGVDLGSVKKMYIGVGNRVIPRAGGTGTIYIDDIRLYRSRCVPSLLKPDADLSGNCVVDLADIEILAGEWLQSGAGLTADLDADADVDLGDFARIANAWLKELLWP